MRLMTFDEMSRDINAVLDCMDRGETVIITRDGKPFARWVSERTIAERVAELMDRYPTISEERAEEAARWMEHNRALENF